MLGLTIIAVILVEMIVIARTATARTVIEKTEVIVVIVPGRLLVAHLPSTMTVDPGPLPLEGMVMIEGLQGTMITGVGAMLTVKALTIMMIVAGMNAETIENATTKKNATKIGLQGKQMGMEGGPAERTLGSSRKHVVRLFLDSSSHRCYCLRRPCKFPMVNGLDTLKLS